jgi:5S rRNA maturation endonuclease (ribonuclease M5)
LEKNKLSELQSFENWKEKLREESIKSDVCVLVEGINDLRKLSNYGIQNIIVLKGQRFYDVAEEILENYNKVVILFDLDKHGNKMVQQFKKIFENEGIEVDLSFREFLKGLNVEEIENLP